MSLLIDVSKSSLEEASVNDVVIDYNGDNGDLAGPEATTAPKVALRDAIICWSIIAASVAMWGFIFAVTTVDLLPALYLMFLTSVSILATSVFAPLNPVHDSFRKNYPGFIVLYLMTAISGIVLALPIGIMS